ncbi:uncharacterized protein EAF01_010863 [Botrytis porri]|uniref:uncharacterized protein n=1 Tax=Botrytis porri TaxID=87229 RepID=UPI0019004974|nr:uncharacterized protein EAF01_010863 [Botrytis porri]KAF7889370.1 hypothetical protein EAF01_010863 [Botrytis porri]
METQGQFVWRYDNAWDNVSIDSKHYDAMRRLFVNKGYLMTWNGNFYIFAAGERCWVLLVSDTGAKTVCMSIGIENASTNYVKAMSPYANWLTKHCGERSCGVMPQSVCIGTRRLAVSIDGDTLNFRDCEDLLPGSRSSDVRAAQASIYPVTFVKLPLQWLWPGAGNIETFLYPLFDTDQDMDTLRWHVGNSIVDPGGTPRALILFGPGGTGKTTVLNTVMECMQGCCGILPPGTFTSYSSALSPEVKSELVGRRMVTCADVDLDTRPIDVNALKSIVGADYIADGMNRFKLSCSLMMASNGLSDPGVSSETLSDAVLRRVVVINLRSTASILTKVAPSERQEDKLDFICSSIYTRLSHTYVPISPRSMLLTICQLQWLAVRDHVEECDEPTIADYQDVLSIVHAYTNLSTDQIMHKAMLISRSGVVEVLGFKYLKGLRPRRQSVVSPP